MLEKYRINRPKVDAYAIELGDIFQCIVEKIKQKNLYRFRLLFSQKDGIPVPYGTEGSTRVKGYSTGIIDLGQIKDMGLDKNLLPSDNKNEPACWLTGKFYFTLCMRKYGNNLYPGINSCGVKSGSLNREITKIKSKTNEQLVDNFVEIFKRIMCRYEDFDIKRLERSISDVVNDLELMQEEKNQNIDEFHFQIIDAILRSLEIDPCYKALNVHEEIDDYELGYSSFSHGGADPYSGVDWGDPSTFNQAAWDQF